MTRGIKRFSTGPFVGDMFVPNGGFGIIDVAPHDSEGERGDRPWEWWVLSRQAAAPGEPLIGKGYDPLRKPSLRRAFLNLGTDPGMEDVVRFADRYGLLTAGEAAGGAAGWRLGEPLAVWHTTARTLHAVDQLWEAFRRPTSGALGALVHWESRDAVAVTLPGLDTWVTFTSDWETFHHWRYGDLRRPAAHALQALVSGQLQETTAVELRGRGVIVRPLGVAGALWLDVAHLLTGSRPEPELRCVVCGRRFIPERQTARYCSDACKARAYRDRRRKEGSAA